MPFWVSRRTGTLAAMVEAAVCFAKQRVAIAKFFSGVADLRGRHWYLPQRTLESIATRLPEGTDPLTVTTWGEEKREMVPETPPPAKPPEPVSTGNLEMDEFLDDMARNTGTERGVLAYWWLTFCKQVQHYLINREKPVPMYFIKLHASPYRQNWKWIVLSRVPGYWRALQFLNKSQRKLELEGSGFMNQLSCLDLLALHKRHGVIYRYVEVEHEKGWHKEVRRVEQERVRRLGWLQYAEHVGGAVRRRFATTIRLYGKWLADLALPVATAVESGDCGELRLAPLVTDVPLGARGWRHWFVPPCIANKHKIHTSRFQADLRFAAVKVPWWVRPVQPAAADVRDGRADVSKPATKETRSPRVLVPHADQGDPAKSNVLAILEHAGQGGMAEGIERRAASGGNV